MRYELREAIFFISVITTLEIKHAAVLTDGAVSRENTERLYRGTHEIHYINNTR